MMILRSKKQNIGFAILLWAGFFLAYSSLGDNSGNFDPNLQGERVYFAPDGKIFIAKEQKIYLYFATSPLKGAQRYPITGPRPIELDSSGKHRILYAHPGQFSLTNPRKIKDFTQYQFFVDGNGPNIQISFENAPRYQAKNNTIIYGRNLAIKVSGQDFGSGVKETLIAINNDDFTAYTEKIQINQEGNYVVRAYGVDNVQNKGRVVTTSFTIDLTPPVTTHTFMKNYQNYYLAKDSAISFQATDSTASVKEIKYFIQGPNNREMGTWRGKPIPLRNYKQSLYTLTYWSIDNTNNIEEKNSVKFFLDKKAPQNHIGFIGPQYQKNGMTYISKNTKIALSATDLNAGVKRIIYNFNHKSREKRKLVYTHPLPVMKLHGVHQITFQSCDQIDNYTSPTTKMFFVDTNPPNTWHKFQGPLYKNGPVTYISPKTKVVLYSSDEDSGINDTRFSINYSNDYIIYNKPITISKSGPKIISYFTFDKVKNIEQKKTFNVFLDDSPPKIIQQISDQKIKDKTVDGKIIPVYPIRTILFLAATDLHAGLESIYFQVNKDPKKKLTTAGIPLTQTGLYRFKVSAVDRVGNKASEKFDIYIGKRELMAH